MKTTGGACGSAGPAPRGAERHKEGSFMRQVALVTGASRGIGRAVALELGRAGYAVCINYLNSQAAAGRWLIPCGRRAAMPSPSRRMWRTVPPWRTWSGRRRPPWAL